MERMLDGSPKGTFRSLSNGVFEDALDIQVAITAERFQAWWAQENRDIVRYVSYPAESLVRLATSIRMIMSLDGVHRMSMYRPASESGALTTLHEKDHIEKTLPGLEAAYLMSRPMQMCDGAQVAMWVIEVHQGRMRSLSDPKVNVLKLTP